MHPPANHGPAIMGLGVSRCHPRQRPPCPGPPFSSVAHQPSPLHFAACSLPTAPFAGSASAPEVALLLPKAATNEAPRASPTYLSICPPSTTYHTVGWAQETAFDESQTLSRSCQNRPSSSSPPPRKSQNLHQPPQQQTPVSPALHRLRGRPYAAHHTQHSIIITIQYQLPPAARAVTPLGFRLACPAQDRGHFLD